MIEKIKQEIKQAILDKNELRKGVLRAVQANAQLKAKMEKRDLKDEDVLDALNKEKKSYLQAIKMCEDNNSQETDFFKKTQDSLHIIEEFLPKQISEDEAKNEIKKLLDGMDTSNFGLVMGKVMTSLKGKMDGKTLSKLVKDYLQNK